MYCKSCSSLIEDGSKFCTFCGAKTDAEPSARPAVSGFGASAQPAKDMPQRGGGGGFNLSKPLCLFFALILLLFFTLPWLRASARVDGMTLMKDTGVPVFRIHSIIERGIGLSGVEAQLTSEGAQLVWLLKGLVLILEGLFFLIALHILLFGIIGLFSAGKARYYFARVGSTGLFIGMCIFIALAFIGNSALGALSRDVTAAGGTKLALSIAPSVWAYLIAAAALIFRVFGIRLLRRLNGMSCLKKGEYETAKRELTRIGRAELYHDAVRGNSDGFASKEYGTDGEGL